MEANRILRGNRVLRYTVEERIVHWISGVSYVYLLLNGLALWSPSMWWMVAILGGGPLARATHPWMGLVFVASVLYMYKLWKPDMQITAKDREWGKTLGAYVRNEEEEMAPVAARRSFDQWAPVDRFNLGQKYLFWLMLWSGIVLLLTGLVLWFTEYIPWSLRFLRYISVVLHPIAFLATLGGFIIHVYMGTAVVRGGFSAVVRGDVSESWARHYHRLWLDRITGNAPTKK
jgi:formate dehydrogenase subunit gamma